MSQDVLERVLQSPRLPSLPAIAIDVINLTQQPDVNLRIIADTVRHDPALSTKILKAVNSSFYGQSAISTISHALVVLGLNSVKTLALGFSLVSNVDTLGGEGFDHMDFWKRSLYAAAASRALVKQVGLVQPEEGFLGGLLQDLGMLAMHQTLGEPYGALVAKAGTEHRALVAMEQAEFQTDHAQIGGALAEHWKLPPLLVNPIRFHEEPDGAPEELSQLISCVVVGGRVADVFISDEPGEALDAYYTHAGGRLNIDREQAEPLLKEIHTDTTEMKRLFALPTGELGNPDEILAQANEALLQISLSQQREASELAQQNRQLAEQSLTDGLTGVANRRHFNQFVEEQFRSAEQAGSDLSLLFMDIDNFKQVNDTHGHGTGDSVLVELAGVLKGTASQAMLVARYGGEEFAVVLPGQGLKAAVRLAESIRTSVENAAVSCDDGQKIHVTVSIGVAAMIPSVFSRADQLVNAADQSLYAAKAAGRNCVRIFVPSADSKRVA